MKTGKFYGIVKEGKLHLDNKTVYDLWLSNFDGVRLELTVKKEAEDVSMNQWAYLYACVYTPLSQEIGYSIEEVDGVLKRMFLTRNKGTKKEYIKDKAKLNKAEIAEYIDNCIQVAAECGIAVLPANKYWRQRNKKL